MEITIEIIKGEDFFVGAIKEIPEVITRGYTIDETKSNISDALKEYLLCLQEL
jgi:predicted RNase H-like HicB family nuclease